MSGLGSAGQGNIVLYDGLVGGEGHVPEVEGGQVLELSPLPRMQMEKHEEDIASHVHSDVCWKSKSGLVFISSLDVKLCDVVFYLLHW